MGTEPKHDAKPKQIDGCICLSCTAARQERWYGPKHRATELHHRARQLSIVDWVRRTLKRLNGA